MYSMVFNWGFGICSVQKGEEGMKIKRIIGFTIATSCFFFMVRLLALTEWRTILKFISAGLFVGVFSEVLRWCLKDDEKGGKS